MLASGRRPQRPLREGADDGRELASLTIVLLVAFTGQVPDLLFHHGLHQREPRFTQQVAYTLLQHADDVGMRPVVPPATSHASRLAPPMLSPELISPLCNKKKTRLTKYI